MAPDLFYHIALDAGGVNYDLSEDISSLVIDEASHRPATVTIVMSDPFKVFSHAFQEGMDLTIDLGDVKDHSIIFRGQIYKVEGDFPKSGVPRLTLRGYDPSMQMGLRKRNRIWKNKKLSEIATQIAETEHGFKNSDIKVTVDKEFNPTFAGNGIRQQNETDLAFLLRLAATFGCETFVTADEAGSTFHFITQQALMTKTPPVTLYYGRCDVDNRLLSFTPNSDVSNIQLPRVYTGMEYQTGKATQQAKSDVKQVVKTDDQFFDENLAEFSKKESKKAAKLKALITAAKDIQKQVRQELGDVERVTVEGFSTSDEIRLRSQNQFSTSVEGMRASGTTPGNKNLHAQSTVCIQDVGGRFSGAWYLSAVKHTLNNQGYKCSFECQR